MHGRKLFPGTVVMTRSTRKKGHEEGEKTCLLYLAQEKNRQLSLSKGMFEITTPGRDGPIYGTSNVSENTGSVPDFHSSYHDVCNKFLGNVNGGWGLDTSVLTYTHMKNSNQVRFSDQESQCTGPPRLTHCWPYVAFRCRRTLLL